MNQIHILDQQTANSIAAGEVVERPASVVKELVENALDAGASVLTIEIRQGGISLIRVTDNGSGMSRDDAMLSFARHSTSKISRIEDLDSIATMGFRGEALASVAAVARVRLETRQVDDEDGTWLQMAGGELLDSGRSGCPSGTVIAVENLFYNVPARFKFLRKDATEAGAVTDVIERLALARPDVSFRLISNQQEILHTPGNNDLTSTVYAVYGKQIASGSLSVNGVQPPLRLSGLVGRPDLARNSRAQQSFFVNGRLVRARSMTAALDDAYETLLMKGKYAFAVLFLQVPPQLVDVNVHPQKMEVRFWNDQEVFRMVYHTIKNTLIAGAGVAGEQAAAPPLPITGEPAKPAAEYTIAAPVEQSAMIFSEKESILENPSNAAPLPFAETPFIAGQQQMPLLKINDLDQARLIGQLFDTYILLELDQELLLIDQHAAHEKILFEALISKHRQARARGAAMPVQALLAPLILETSRREMQFLHQELQLFQQLGFDYDDFGPSAIALRSLPDAGLHPLQPETAFRLALDTLLADLPNTEEKIADFYYSMACKAAVKAADHLNPAEIERLLADLRQLDNPYQCPHGRPVVVRLTQYEMEKRFKRIV
jgi:DNA mismatch repair protein MutL